MTDNVVKEPIALKDVNPVLLKKPAKPVCEEPQPKANAAGEMRVNVAEVRAWAKCYAAAVDDIYARLTGLQRSVISRQNAAKRAVEAAKI